MLLQAILSSLEGGSTGADRLKNHPGVGKRGSPHGRDAGVASTQCLVHGSTMQVVF